MKDEIVFIAGYPGYWRKTKAHGMYLSQKLGKDRKLNAQLYIASCLYILRYQDERTGVGVDWDAMFMRVQSSKKSFAPTLLWRDDMKTLNRTAYRILESLLIEENSLKHLAREIDNRPAPIEESRAEELRSHRRGKYLMVWALNKFHAMLTNESFYGIFEHDPLRADPSAYARRPKVPNETNPS